MRQEFKLPDIGEGVVEGEIVRWLVNEGDEIAEDQPMVEVMTDKATVSLPSPYAGKVVSLMAKEGDVVEVGKTLLIIEVAGDGNVESPAAAEPATAGAPKEAASLPPTAAPPSAGSAAVSPPETPVAPTMPQAHKKVLATPAIRKMAREMGIDIARVQGTGRGGRVTREDLRRFDEERRGKPAAAVAQTAPVAQQAPPVAAHPAPLPTPPRPAAGTTPPREERIPFRGLRKRIAEKMVQSAFTATHFTYVNDVDMTELVAFREKMKPLAEARGVKLTYLPFIVKASIVALKAFPLLNASLDEAAGEIVLKYDYNIGIATATDAGLIVPVVHHADRLSLIEIARRIGELAEKARTGKIALEELQGSTFTITSLGAEGGLLATPIINFPEVAIMGVHKLEDRPVVRNGEIVIRKMMNLSLSFDHRIIDGHVGAAFCNRIAEVLQSPDLLFLEMS